MVDRHVSSKMSWVYTDMVSATMIVGPRLVFRKFYLTISTFRGKFSSSRMHFASSCPYQLTRSNVGQRVSLEVVVV